MGLRKRPTAHRSVGIGEGCGVGAGTGAGDGAGFGRGVGWPVGFAEGSGVGRGRGRGVGRGDGCGAGAKVVSKRMNLPPASVQNPLAANPRPESREAPEGLVRDQNGSSAGEPVPPPPAAAAPVAATWKHPGSRQTNSKRRSLPAAKVAVFTKPPATLRVQVKPALAGLVRPSAAVDALSASRSPNGTAVDPAHDVTAGIGCAVGRGVGRLVGSGIGFALGWLVGSTIGLAVG